MANQRIISMRDARIMLRQEHSGVLSTLSVNQAGYPFGSIIPYMINSRGQVIIYASDIAQHSKNMQADPRVSLCVHDATVDDSQASGRVTILGDAQVDVVSEYDIARYYALFPKAVAYKEAHDFRFYAITPTRVRYIGGFGKIFWFEKDEWLGEYVSLDDVESGAIAHMHDDHLDAIAAIMAAALTAAGKEKTVQSLQSHRLISIFHDGVHVSDGKQLHFVPFESSLTASDELRSAMVALTKSARA